MSETVWKHIESAPRDGTHIILAFGSDHVGEGWFEDDDTDPRPWKFIDRGCQSSRFKAGELINASRDGRYGPSHWHPMPLGLSKVFAAESLAPEGGA
jgi:hypothetical protein